MNSKSKKDFDPWVDDWESSVSNKEVVIPPEFNSENLNISNNINSGDKIIPLDSMFESSPQNIQYKPQVRILKRSLSQSNKSDHLKVLDHSISKTSKQLELERQEKERKYKETRDRIFASSSANKSDHKKDKLRSKK